MQVAMILIMAFNLTLLSKYSTLFIYIIYITVSDIQTSLWMLSSYANCSLSSNSFNAFTITIYWI